MKQCTRCLQTKPTVEFNRSSRNLDGRHAYCRDCQKAHYRSNIVRHKANVARSRKLRKDEAHTIVAARFSGGCVDCGTSDMRVLQFDHVRGDKVDTVSSMIRRGRSIRSIVAEMDKCEVRCANCHMIATMTRLGTSWHSRFASPPSA